ncbi:hypothetical protein DFQ28_006227 [Apophysomyces sp. BC1034]|nr:hypothetical protein DFQ30_005453 [Apophysomyces sp. BC1015]KAG0177769.1 hypothetical protein DFQ29_004345 [Apophysomyces sp. BC1021]KAG0187535.1 hypothetical protein DFQ28_006227 [Apophysomyces sp. BC1034]
MRVLALDLVPCHPETHTHLINKSSFGLQMPNMAFFNDQTQVARFIFEQRSNESPFHAAGCAMLGFVEATLDCFAPEKLQAVLDQIVHAETMARRYAGKQQQKDWAQDEDEDAAAGDETASHGSRETVPAALSLERDEKGSSGQTFDFQYRLLVVNCMVMSVAIELLRDNWVDYMKAVYKLRKAYRMYEHMFQTMTGLTTSTSHAGQLRSILSSDRKNVDHLHPRPETLRRSSTWTEGLKVRGSNATEMIEGGVYFGLGLFNLVLSFLPSKVNAILKTFGLCSSRTFSVGLLKMAHRIQGIYTPVAGLALLSYYTSLPLFIHPDLLPESLDMDYARTTLEKLKTNYPRNNLWKLLEGRMCKMEGKVERSLALMREARKRTRQDFDDGQGNDATEHKKHDYTLSGLTQFQLCAVYEIGWAQILLGQWSDAAETFFQLESMSNGSTIFYHYIASCCILSGGSNDKAALEFLQIPRMLDKKRQNRAKVCLNEEFAERRIQRWISRARKISANTTTTTTTTSGGSGSNGSPAPGALTGMVLKQVMDVNPLWELIYLSNGVSQLPRPSLETMRDQLEAKPAQEDPMACLLLGVVQRELGSYDAADHHLRKLTDGMQGEIEDWWVVPYAMYEVAILRCFQRLATESPVQRHKQKVEAKEWIQRTEQFFQQQPQHPNPSGDTISDWENRLFIRCQLLLEKLDES